MIRRRVPPRSTRLRPTRAAAAIRASMPRRRAPRGGRRKDAAKLRSPNDRSSPLRHSKRGGDYSFARASAWIAFVAVAASSSLAKPIAAENFLPTTWAIRKAMLTFASEMAREMRAPRPRRSSPSTSRQGVSDCTNPNRRASASAVGPSIGNTSIAARSSSVGKRYAITIWRCTPAAASGSRASASNPLRSPPWNTHSFTCFTVSLIAMRHPCPECRSSETHASYRCSESMHNRRPDRTFSVTMRSISVTRARSVGWFFSSPRRALAILMMTEVSSQRALRAARWTRTVMSRGAETDSIGFAGSSTSPMGGTTLVREDGRPGWSAGADLALGLLPQPFRPQGGLELRLQLLALVLHLVHLVEQQRERGLDLPKQLGVLLAPRLEVQVLLILIRVDHAVAEALEDVEQIGVHAIRPVRRRIALLRLLQRLELLAARALLEPGDVQHSVQGRAVHRQRRRR